MHVNDERKNTYQEVWAANYYSLILINEFIKTSNSNTKPYTYFI